MAIHRLFWKGYTTKDRNVLLEEIKEMLLPAGFITDFHFFSDLSITLEIDILGRKLPDLKTGLEKILNLEAGIPEAALSDGNLLLLLNISFVKGTGKEKHIVPAVPG